MKNNSREKYGTGLDHVEPDLNQATPGDPQDTNTPDAMLKTMRKIVTGDSLTPASRDQITRWLIDNKTGDKKLRAGPPAGWRVGDKTGGGGYGINNDISVLWPIGRAPMLVTSFPTQSSSDLGARDRAIAEVGRGVAMVAGVSADMSLGFASKQRYCAMRMTRFGYRTRSEAFQASNLPVTQWIPAWTAINLGVFGLNSGCF